MAEPSGSAQQGKARLWITPPRAKIAPADGDLQSFLGVEANREGRDRDVLSSVDLAAAGERSGSRSTSGVLPNLERDHRRTLRFGFAPSLVKHRAKKLGFA